MAGKHTNSLELGDFDRLRKENAVLRDELAHLREEISGERHTHEQMLKSFQACHNEDTRKLREEKKLTSKLAEENGELRLELKEHGKRASTSSSTRDRENFKPHEADLSARLLMELTALGQRLGTLHSDLLSSPVAKSSHGKPSSNHGELGISSLFIIVLTCAGITLVYRCV